MRDEIKPFYSFLLHFIFLSNQYPIVLREVSNIVDNLFISKLYLFNEENCVHNLNASENITISPSVVCIQQ